MTALAVLLVAASLGFGIAHLLRVPPLPILVLAGMAASAVYPLPAEFLEDAIMLGVTVVVFVAGIELNPTRVGRYRRAAASVGLIQFLILGLAGLGAALLLGFELQMAAYIALALSASSTLVVIRVLQRRRELYEPVGRMVTGVLLLQDLLIILLIPVVTRLGDGADAVAAGLGATLVLVALAAGLLKWVTPRLLPRLEGDEESLLLAVLAILFIFLGLSHLLEVPLLAGAFLAGLTLSAFPVNALVRGQLNSLGDFFSAVFFAALGGLLSLPSATGFLQALALSAVVLVLTPPLVALVSERTGFSARASIHSGLLLAQTSEFSLVVALQGLILTQIDSATFSIIALVTVITMILTPMIAIDGVTGALMRFHPFRPARTDAERPSDHVVLVGCGTNGMALLELLMLSPNELWVVEDDPAVVDRIRGAGVSVVRGDATDVEVLRRAGVSKARIVVSTISRKADNATLLAITHGVPVLVRAFDEEDEEWVKERGGIPIPYSKAAAQDFLDWFLRGKPEEEDVV
jgi:Kef-type K+ transport system membrane component KefB